MTSKLLQHWCASDPKNMLFGGVIRDEKIQFCFVLFQSSRFSSSGAVFKSIAARF